MAFADGLVRELFRVDDRELSHTAFLQLLSKFERWKSLWCHPNFVSGFGVSSPVALVVFYRKAPESTNLNSLSAC